MYSLLLIILILVSCTSGEAPFPTATTRPQITPPSTTTPAPNQSPVLTPLEEPSSTPIPPQELETPLPQNSETVIEGSPSIIIPDQPTLNTISISQLFIVQSPSLMWKLVEYDPVMITLLSSTEAGMQEEIPGWKFKAIAPGQTTIIIEQETPVCDNTPCPPEALIQQSVTINITG